MGESLQPDLNVNLPEMCVQMLGRGTYTHEQISRFLKCPVWKVGQIEDTMPETIAAIHAEYLRCEAIANRVSAGHRHDNDGVDAGCIYIAHTLFNGHRNRMDPGLWDGGTE